MKGLKNRRLVHIDADEQEILESLAARLDDA